MVQYLQENLDYIKYYIINKDDYNTCFGYCFNMVTYNAIYRKIFFQLSFQNEYWNQLEQLKSLIGAVQDQQTFGSALLFFTPAARCSLSFLTSSCFLSSSAFKSINCNTKSGKLSLLQLIKITKRVKIKLLVPVFCIVKFT